MRRCADNADFHAALDDQALPICVHLRLLVDKGLPDATSKITPIVGYSRLKDCARPMFWSGQSFTTQSLAPSGSFKAAEARYTDLGQIDGEQITGWLADARTTRWDGKNSVKRKGRLERPC